MCSARPRCEPGRKQGALRLCSGWGVWPESMSPCRSLVDCRISSSESSSSSVAVAGSSYLEQLDSYFELVNVSIVCIPGVDWKCTCSLMYARGRVGRVLNFLGWPHFRIGHPCPSGRCASMWAGAESRFELHVVTRLPIRMGWIR